MSGLAEGMAEGMDCENGIRCNESVLLQQKVSQKKSLHSRILSWKWKEFIIIAIQLVAFTACNMAYSLMIPFFPGEVKS